MFNIFIGLHSLLPEAASRVEVLSKKCVLKTFVNFIGKYLCWSLFYRPDTYFEEHLPKTDSALQTHHSLLLIRFTLDSAPSFSTSLLLLRSSHLKVFYKKKVFIEILQNAPAPESLF